jgi:hypothetical protein
MKHAIRIAVLVALLMGTGAGIASASPDRISRGQAQAVLNAAGNGGGAIHNHGGGNGAPADADSQVAIRAYYDNGLHYCVEDWHVITLGQIIHTTSMQEARMFFDPTVMTFVLDGSPLETTRTPIKAFLNQNFVEKKGYSFAQGRLMAPGELTVGSHVQVVTVNDPSLPEVEVLTNQFFIDAAGTGTCL